MPVANSHIPQDGNRSPKISVFAMKNAVQSTHIHPTSASAASEGNFRYARQEWAMDRCSAPKKKQNVCIKLASFNCGTRGLNPKFSSHAWPKKVPVRIPHSIAQEPKR
jgi:hypothetical protein